MTPPPWWSWWAIALYCIVLGGGVVLFFLAQKRKLANERLVNERLLQVDRLKDDFLANTSHELRTPLNGINGIVESLMEGVAGALPPRATANLAMVLSSGKRLSNLINDILDFSKLKNHGIELQSGPVDLRAIAEVVLTLMQPLLDDRSLMLVNAIDPETPPVAGDEGRIQQILYNLVGNAVKYTERGEIRVAARVEQEKVTVSVTGTGAGIPANELARIFESFQRGSEGPQPGQGTGLGLAITKQLVELHWGEIGARSAVGSGSEFCFSLPLSHEAKPMLPGDRVRTCTVEIFPLHDDHVVPFPAERRESPSGEETFTILIVEDDRVNRQVLVNHLSLEKYHIVEAAGGEEALRLVEELAGAIDLVLLDIMMPKMSGYTVCKALRKKFSVNDLPVIFLTAKNQVSDLVAGFSFGANDYLTKPISRNELVSRVRTHLQLLDINRHLERKVMERTGELRARNDELETLNDIVKTINHEIELEKVLQILLQEGLNLFPQARKGVLFTRDGEAKYFVIAAAAGYELGPLKEMRFTRDELVARYTRDSQALERDIYIIRDVENLPAREKFQRFPKPACFLALALLVEEKLVGFLVLDNFESPAAFGPSGVKRLDRFREHAVSALAKARILQELRIKNEAIVRTQKQMLMQEKMASLGILTAGIAHEIKNPLNFINNFAELCVEHAEELKSFCREHISAFREPPFELLRDLLEEIRENSDLICRHGNRANEIIQSMMALSQTKPAEHRDQDTNVLLVAYLNFAYQGRRMKMPGVRVVLEKDFHEDVGTLWVVPQNLGRVIINMINNAFDAVLEKATTAKEPYTPKIWVRSKRVAGGVEIHVGDNGNGIPEPIQDKIFTPFYSTKSKAPGNAGLGLAICYDIIAHEHGGEIRLRSRVSGYSEFVIFLPETAKANQRQAVSGNR